MFNKKPVKLNQKARIVEFIFYSGLSYNDFITMPISLIRAIEIRRTEEGKAAEKARLKAEQQSKKQSQNFKKYGHR